MKPLVWRSLLVSKQSVRVARARHRPSPCTLCPFCPACHRSGPSRSQPHSMPAACRRTAGSSSCARSRHAWIWSGRSPGHYATIAILPASAHRARHRRHRRSRSRPAGTGSVQRPLRLHLLPADPLPAASRQAALRRRRGEGPAPCDPPHPQALAGRRHSRAR